MIFQVHTVFGDDKTYNGIQAEGWYATSRIKGLQTLWLLFSSVQSLSHV